MLRVILKPVLFALAVVFLLTGIVMLPMPVPFSFVPLIIGLMLLFAASPGFRRWFHRQRRRRAWLDRWYRTVVKFLPPPLRRALSPGKKDFPPAGHQQ